MINKKSSLFYLPIVVIISFLVLVYLYSILISKNAPIADNPIGKRQFDLLNTYIKSESALFYIDQSAKYSLNQAVYDLASNAGHYDLSDCGFFEGINALASIEKEGNNIKIKKCYANEDELKNNLKKYFEDVFSLYLANYPDALLPASYNYEFGNNLEITGRAAENLVIEILPDDFEVKPEITATKPSEIYQQVVSGTIPQKLNVPMKSNPDVETIKQYHPEVWIQYTELCRRMGHVSLGIPPGVCSAVPTKCCITSGYRHPAYNKEIGGATNSPHQYGVALDIYVSRGAKEQLRWVKAATNEEPKLFTRAGIYPGQTNIHVDLMPPREEFVSTYWIGNKGKTIVTASSINQLESEAGKFG